MLFFLFFVIGNLVAFGRADGTTRPSGGDPLRLEALEEPQPLLREGQRQGTLPRRQLERRHGRPLSAVLELGQPAGEGYQGRAARVALARMPRYVPAMIFWAWSRFGALRSSNLVFAMSRHWLRVTTPTFSARATPTSNALRARAESSSARASLPRFLSGSTTRCGSCLRGA